MGERRECQGERSEGVIKGGKKSGKGTKERKERTQCGVGFSTYFTPCCV